MIKCVHCGKDVSEYAPKCPNCGHKIDEIPTDIVNPKNPAKRSPLDIKIKLLICCAAVALVSSSFVFACAYNAYNAVMGKSIAGIGVIFFEKYIVASNIRPIMTAMVCAGTVVAVSAVIIALCVLGYIKKAESSNGKI